MADETTPDALVPAPAPAPPSTVAQNTAAARMGPWEGAVHLAAIVGCLVLGGLALRCAPPQTSLAEYALAGVVLLGGIRVADVLSYRVTGRGVGPVGPAAVLTLAALTALLGG